MQCIIMENTLIKLTLHDETKKMAHDSQIVRAKENLKLSHGVSCSTHKEHKVCSGDGFLNISYCCSGHANCLIGLDFDL